jgi:hypothetical protein
MKMETAGFFGLELDNLQEFIANNELKKQEAKMEKSTLDGVIKETLRTCLLGDFSKMKEKAKIYKYIFDSMSNDENHNQDAVVDCLAILEGNY